MKGLAPGSHWDEGGMLAFEVLSLFFKREFDGRRESLLWTVREQRLFSRSQLSERARRAYRERPRELPALALAHEEDGERREKTPCVCFFQKGESEALRLNSEFFLLAIGSTSRTNSNSMNFVRSLWRGPPSPNTNSGIGGGGVGGSSAAAASSPAGGGASGSSSRGARRATTARAPTSAPSSRKAAVARSSPSPPPSSSAPDPDPDPELERRALALRTPHSGYHFDGTGRRFFEGWYFKVTLPGEAQAFALIYSIEDPKTNGGGGGGCAPPASSSSAAAAAASPSSRPGLGVQIMGPDDSYIIQYDPDVSKFWAKDPELALGACFEAARKEGAEGAPAPPPPPSGPVAAAEFDESVALGFQATATWHQGSVVSREAGASGSLHSTVSKARWAFKVEPVLGW